MKQVDIKVGGQYLTIVSGHRTRVQVTGVKAGYNGRIHYEVIRVDNGKRLMERDCMALRPCRNLSTAIDHTAINPTDETA